MSGISVLPKETPEKEMFKTKQNETKTPDVLKVKIRYFYHL